MLFILKLVVISFISLILMGFIHDFFRFLIGNMAKDDFLELKDSCKMFFMSHKRRMQYLSENYVRINQYRTEKHNKIKEKEAKIQFLYAVYTKRMRCSEEILQKIETEAKNGNSSCSYDVNYRVRDRNKDKAYDEIVQRVASELCLDFINMNYQVKLKETLDGFTLYISWYKNDKVSSIIK